MSPDGLRISVTEYPVRGGSAVLVIDAQTGGVLARYDAPDDLQVIETVWLEDRVYASAISPAGSAIYDVTGGFAMVLDCGKSNVKDLDEFGGAIAFSSDITGVREFYAMHEGKAYRMTVSAQGGDDFCFTPALDTLVYTGLTASGRHIYKTPVSGLPEPVPADFGTAHAYELARDIQTPVPIDKDSVIVLPEPSRYNRFAHLLRVHSWAPVYVSTDAISELSFESITSSAGLGASVFFQNELETLVGSAAYGATFDDDGWHHTVETKFTYSGLYPKFEATLSLGSDPARQYFLQKWYSGFAGHEGLGARNLDGIPSFNASLLAYVPLNLSSGGWYRGIVPQLRFGLSNSYITYNPSSPMNRLTASVRGYVVSGTPSNGIYPRLGAGMEAGWSGRVGSTWLFAPNAYLFGYGYLPGILRSHGIKLTATLQAPLGSAMYTERYATVLPRGMDSYVDLASLLSSYPFQSRFTFDYAFPFLPLDWSALCPVAYVRNLECTLHADGSFFTAGGSDRMALASAGADLCVVLGNLAWVPYPTRIGVSGWWNWGAPEDKKPWNIGLVFNVDF